MGLELQPPTVFSTTQQLHVCPHPHLPSHCNAWLLPCSVMFSLLLLLLLLLQSDTSLASRLFAALGAEPSVDDAK
jgi:hypothetical protein